MQERLVPFDGAVNFRDIGGYPAGEGRRTRWRTVYRSDSLAELSAPDLDRLAAMGLYGIVDFRLPSERKAKPDRLPEGHGMKLVTQGFIPAETEDMLRRIAAGRLDAAGIFAEVTGHYRLFATDHLGEYVSAFRMILAAEGRPVLLHCTSGKDRTGFGVALLLLLAGCDTQTVTSDYVMSDRYRRDIRFMFRGDIDPEAIAMLTAARPEYIATALETLARVHGAPESWLAEMGFDAAERARLREAVSEAVSR